MRWIPIVFVVLGLLVLALGAAGIVSSLRFLRRSVTARAVVTGHDVERNPSTEPGSRTTTRCVVRFIAQDGRTLQVTAVNSVHAEVGAHVTVRYDPRLPDKPRLTGDAGEWILSGVAVLVGFLLALIGTAVSLIS
jgi:hypothetical protein